MCLDTGASTLSSTDPPVRQTVRPRNRASKARVLLGVTSERVGVNRACVSAQLYGLRVPWLMPQTETRVVVVQSEGLWVDGVLSPTILPTLSAEACWMRDGPCALVHDCEHAPVREH
eukprot:6191290-Pleurochrysis_carterae.AAC.7